MVDFNRKYGSSMIPEKWLTDVGEQIVKDYIQDDRNSALSEMSQVKHVIEHKIAQPPTNLPPINQPRAPPVIYQQPPPPPQVIPMQQPTPQIIAAPGPQHIITGYPNPVIHNLGQPEKRGGMFNKEDFGEMMMMQNAQMHQMVMQKLMLGNLGRQEHYDHHGGCHDCHSGCCSSHGVHGSCANGHCGHGACYDCSPAVPRVNGAVHHHHYSTPPSQPPVTHYTTLPAMDIRGSYPYREYASAYTGPGYAYAGYDDGDNYYAYH